MAGVALSSRLTGRPGLGVERRAIALGRLSLCLGQLEARYICVDDVELVRRIFVGVRDVDWGTARTSDEDSRVDIAADGFEATMSAICRDTDHGIDLSWAGTLSGGAEGAIAFEFEGTPARSFPYARIGICVLHPPEFAGGRYRARAAEGWLEGSLEEAVAPQLPGEHGFGEPLFPAFDELELYRPDGAGARLELSGDLFELEDQRNWTDASYKTYSTPLKLGPQTAHPERPIRQRVTITPIIPAGRRRPAPDRRHKTIRIGSPTQHVVPEIGIQLARQGDLLPSHGLELVRMLSPAHIRADLLIDDDSLPEQVQQAVSAARALDAALELAIIAGSGRHRNLSELAQLLHEHQPRLARVLVFREGQPVTSAADIAAVRDCLTKADLRPPIYGGTNLGFADLNAARPTNDGLDGIAFPLVPTVHADDDLSLVETMSIFGDVVRTARTFAMTVPLAVTPISLRERPQSDERQPSLLGAVWTLGAASSLANAGAEAATFYETVGSCGVLEPGREAATPTVFPIFHILTDLCEWQGWQLISTAEVDPLSLAILAVRTAGGGLSALIANALPRPNRVHLDGLPPGPLRIRRLNEDSFETACREPQRFREGAEVASVEEIELTPYEILRLDWQT